MFVKPLTLISLLRLTSSSSCLKGDSFCQLPCIPSCLSSASDKTAVAQTPFTVQCCHILRRCTKSFLLHQFSPPCGLQWLLTSSMLPFVVTCFAQLVCVSCSSFCYNNARWENLTPPSIAFVVAHVQGPLRLTDCARDKAEFLDFFLTKFFKPLLPRYVVLRFR